MSIVDGKKYSCDVDTCTKEAFVPNSVADTSDFVTREYKDENGAKRTVHLCKAHAARFDIYQARFANSIKALIAGNKEKVE